MDNTRYDGILINTNLLIYSNIRGVQTRMYLIKLY